MCDKIEHPERVNLMDITKVIYEDKTAEILNEDLTLADISPPSTVTGAVLVITEDPWRGKVYRYGNHGKYWELIGTTCGYA